MVPATLFLSFWKHVSHRGPDAEMAVTDHQVGTSQAVPVVSENANEAESPNPRGVLEFAETRQRGTGSAIDEPEQKLFLQTIRYVQLVRWNSYAAARW